VSDVPVTPDADTARQWAVDELSKQQYQPHGPSLTERLIQWINDVLSHLPGVGGGLSGVQIVLVILVLALIVTGIVFLIVGPMRRARRRGREHSVFEDDARSAAAMRSASEAAARDGQWGLALLERYRAVIRSLEERDLLEERAGMTAHEAAELTAARFTDVAGLARGTAEVFDAVRYGDGDAQRGDYARAVELDETLARRTLLSRSAP